jgi:hypothetical protein
MLKQSVHQEAWRKGKEAELVAKAEACLPPLGAMWKVLDLIYRMQVEIRAQVAKERARKAAYVSTIWAYQAAAEVARKAAETQVIVTKKAIMLAAELAWQVAADTMDLVRRTEAAVDLAKRRRHAMAACKQAARNAAKDAHRLAGYALDEAEALRIRVEQALEIARRKRELWLAAQAALQAAEACRGACAAVKLMALRARQAAASKWLERRWQMAERAREVYGDCALICFQTERFIKHFALRAAHISAAIAGNRAQWDSYLAAKHAAEYVHSSRIKRKALIAIVKKSRERLGRLEAQKIALQKEAAWRAKLAQLEAETAFQVLVKTLTVGTFTLVVKPSLDVLDVKDQIHDREKGVPTWQFKLKTNTVYKGPARYMEDGEELRHYNVCPGCTIFCDRTDDDGAGLQGDLDPADAWMRL